MPDTVRTQWCVRESSPRIWTVYGSWPNGMKLVVSYWDLAQIFYGDTGRLACLVIRQPESRTVRLV